MKKKVITKAPEDFYYTAIEQHVAGQTIAIFNTRTADVGTGTAININDRPLILTAGHVLSDVRRDELTFAFKTSAVRGGLAVAINLPIADMHIVADPIDLGFILLNSSVLHDMPDLVFLNEKSIAAKTPKANNLSALCGFPVELQRAAKQGSTVNINVRPYIDFPKMIPDPGTLKDFDPRLHFLLQFPKEESRDGKTMIHRLKGMSGASARQLIKNRPDKLWKARTKIIGIQTSVYRSDRIYKCTKSEILLQELNKLK